METRQRLGTGISRSKFLLGSGAVLASASGLGAFAPAALADGVPDGDLAYLRLLIAAELLAVDFYGRVLDGGALRRAGTSVARRIRKDETEHYTLLAALLTADGLTPATADDIDFSYPAIFASRRSILGFAKELERHLIGAYIDALEKLQTASYRGTLAGILAAEAEHHGAVAVLLGEPAIQRSFPSPVRMAAMSNFLDRFES